MAFEPQPVPPPPSQFRVTEAAPGRCRQDGGAPCPPAPFLPRVFPGGAAHQDFSPAAPVTGCRVEVPGKRGQEGGGSGRHTKRQALFIGRGSTPGRAGWEDQKLLPLPGVLLLTQGCHSKVGRSLCLPVRTTQRTRASVFTQMCRQLMSTHKPVRGSFQQLCS